MEIDKSKEYFEGKIITDIQENVVSSSEEQGMEDKTEIIPENKEIIDDTPKDCSGGNVVIGSQEQSIKDSTRIIQVDKEIKNSNFDLLDENIYKVSKEQRIGANKESIQKIKGIISKDNTKEFSVGKMILGSQEHSIQNSKDINEESKNITEDNSNKISEGIVVLGSLEQEIKDNKKTLRKVILMILLRKR